MRNIRINEAESIFEPFYDGGESYPDHQKYACLSEYAIDTQGAGEVSQTWWTAKVVVYGGRKEAVVLERECCLNIREYDIFRVFAIVSKDISMRILCRIDGVDRELIHTTGTGSSKEYNGPMQGKTITKIRMEFVNHSCQNASAELIWLGLSNGAKEKYMMEQESPYDATWPGCFRENPENLFVPQTGLYFDAEELKELRRKLQTPCFWELMDKLRRDVRPFLQMSPEKEIGTFVNRQPNHRFTRERDWNRPTFVKKMVQLAFVGLVDENPEMLRMACRMALSVAHSTYLCESIMGVLPGATWHHRSFTEEVVCRALVQVLDWAGGMLSWHGQNIIYDAIIMKGLPRLDADIKTMDYMWKMNQGPVFASGLVIVNMALQKRYPRYGVRVQEAEKDLLTMWEDYVQSDGGSAEGPHYWEYTFLNITEAMYLLARYYGKPLEEYVPDSIKRSCKFAGACLSDAENWFVPVNDSHVEEIYEQAVLSFLARMETGTFWKKKSNLSLQNRNVRTRDDVLNHLIFGQLYDVGEEDISTADKAEWIHLPVTGHTTLRRNTEDLGTVGLHLISGLITYGHSHGDKGSFILEADGKALLIDRGVCAYDNAFAGLLGNSEYHNLVTAVKGGLHECQNKKDPGSSAVVTEAEYSENGLRYATDVTASWDGIFERNVRKVSSPDPYHYTIEDDLKINPEYGVCFVLNTYGKIREEAGKILIEDGGTELLVSAANWKPQKVEYGPYGVDGKGRPVNRLCLYTGGAEAYSLRTELELRKNGNS